MSKACGQQKRERRKKRTANRWCLKQQEKGVFQKEEGSSVSGHIKIKEHQDGEEPLDLTSRRTIC